jgi:acyl dehydratase
MSNAPTGQGAELRFQVTDGVVRAYAEAASDFNPVHFDAEMAKRVGMPDRIAHGMISGAVLSRLMTRILGDDYPRRGFLHIKFTAPVHPGQWITARAVRKADAPWSFDAWVENESGQKVIVAEAGLKTGA